MLKSIALAAALVSGVAILPAGCAGEAYVVSSDPPAPRAEVVTARPGYIFVHGNWRREGGSWRWHEGHYEADRPHQRYVEGGWKRQGNQRIWVEGGWHNEGGVSIR